MRRREFIKLFGGGALGGFPLGCRTSRQALDDCEPILLHYRARLLNQPLRPDPRNAVDGET